MKDATQPPAEGRERILRTIEAFQAGIDRERQFRILTDSYYRPLRRFFARKGLPPETCLDLTQEAFLGIYRGLDAYRPEARFETWLYRIATTTYLKSVRSRATNKRSGKEVPINGTEGNEPALTARGGQLDAVLWKERRGKLEEAIRELPGQMRRCLVMRIYHELSYRDIATALRLTVGTVKAHLHQGRRKLKERLEDTS